MRETRETEKIYVHTCAHTSLKESFNRFFFFFNGEVQHGCGGLYGFFVITKYGEKLGNAEASAVRLGGLCGGTRGRGLALVYELHNAASTARALQLCDLGRPRRRTFP